VDLLVNYFSLFGVKPCCSSDMKLFLSSLDAADHEDFFARTAAMICIDDGKRPASVRKKVDAI
jgi:hypothetical protein